MSSHINGSWHQKHPMPKKPTLEQRVDWHLAHAKACGCRDIPKTVIAELQRRGQRESGVAGVSNISRSLWICDLFILEVWIQETIGLTSRKSQCRLALSVSLSRFTSRVGGGSASESHVIVDRPVKMATGMTSKLVITNCDKCGRSVSFSKVIHGFAGDSEPLVPVLWGQQYNMKTSINHGLYQIAQTARSR